MLHLLNGLLFTQKILTQKFYKEIFYFVLFYIKQIYLRIVRQNGEIHCCQHVLLEVVLL